MQGYKVASQGYKIAAQGYKVATQGHEGATQGHKVAGKAGFREVSDTALIISRGALPESWPQAL